MNRFMRLFTKDIWTTISRVKGNETSHQDHGVVEFIPAVAVLQKNQFNEYRAFWVKSSGKRHSMDVDYYKELIGVK